MGDRDVNNELKLLDKNNKRRRGRRVDVNEKIELFKTPGVDVRT